jgi:hypothetical protein
VTRTTPKIGDHVIVSGASTRDPAAYELMPVWETCRPSDSWIWNHSEAGTGDI